MSIPTIQPIAPRSGLPLVGSPALSDLSGRDDVRFGPDTVVGLPVGRARRTWDDGTAARGDDTTQVDASPFGANPFGANPVDVADSYPSHLSTELFDGKAVVRFETNPSDIRVTTRGIPV